MAIWNARTKDGKVRPGIIQTDVDCYQMFLDAEAIRMNNLRAAPGRYIRTARQPKCGTKFNFRRG